ncbi:hypothetical protein CFOL_v3_28985 [Cephalotus follicularis]|uniref:Uncharacterized protein n=1 Tax=Cephalotus follicularis TaxID=3775 RepID=A0A1Q3CZA4_CEPFO|nr:hypothetical protein CFOL_v3_28985 [Cephalotus follicularis]
MNMDAEEEDNRREVAIASNPFLQPNFKPTGGVTQQQLSKLQELHRRRLQIKSTSKVHKKFKDGAGNSHGRDLNAKDCEETDLSAKDGDSTVPNWNSLNDSTNSTIQPDNVTVQLAPKKRQKLHWGLDTKERWERKANM